MLQSCFTGDNEDDEYILLNVLVIVITSNSNYK